MKATPPGTPTAQDGRDATIAYYDAHAKDYFDETAHLDNSMILNRFLELIDGKRPAKIADIGCGSGRDLKAMHGAGYDVIGIEPAEQLATLAALHSGVPVIRKSLFEADEIADGSLAGAWACSSLLHIDRADLPAAFSRIHGWLATGGVFYTCFKDGETDTTDARGRRFTNLRSSTLTALARRSNFQVIDLFLTTSTVPGRTQLWHNAILRK